jgi:chloride channel protein, CIC family
VATPTTDPAALMRSKQFVVVLVIAAVIGVVVSFVSWGFLELIHQLQESLFTRLPSRLGFSGVPWWWPLPICGVAGLPIAYAIVRLPGRGGHEPAKGLQAGATEPNMVPGITLAAVATIGFGLVLGPEAPLIALGGGVALFAVKRVFRGAPAPLLMLLAAAGSFAAISVIFGSPVVAAVIMIEASGLGGAQLPLILVPGLIAAGIGSLIFIGLGQESGLNTSAYSLGTLPLPSYARPTAAAIGWTVLIAVGAAVIVFAIRQMGLSTERFVLRRAFLLIPVAGLAVAVSAILFSQVTGKGTDQVLFSGQEGLPGLVQQGGSWPLSAVLLVIVFKGFAWGVSLGSFRGGPTFPAIFIGAAGGILASHLPGLDFTPAIAVGIGAATVAMLKLPLSSIIIASFLTSTTGLGSGPLIILGVVIAYILTLSLEGLVSSGTAGEHAAAAATVPASPNVGATA